MYIQVKKVMYERLIRKYVVYIQVKKVMYEESVCCVHPSKEGYVYIQVKKVMYERLIRKSMLCTSK